MENEAKNRALFELVKPGECWHVKGTAKKRIKHFDYDNGESWFAKADVPVCVHCGATEGLTRNEGMPHSYFDPDLPDSQRVALVKAAVDRFGRFDVGTQLMELTDEGGLHDNPNIDNSYMADFLSITAPAIAEAIYNLIEAERTRVKEKVAKKAKEMMEGEDD